MWIITKVKNKNIEIFKNEFNKEIKNLKIYYPKIIDQSGKIKNLLGDYIFCFHHSFNFNFRFDTINNIKGLDYILSGSSKDQIQIKHFIDFCFKNQNDDGLISNNFFKKNISNRGKIICGPLTNFFFREAEKQKNRLNVYVGNFKISISDKSRSLYQSI